MENNVTEYIELMRRKILNSSNRLSTALIENNSLATHKLQIYYDTSCGGHCLIKSVDKETGGATEELECVSKFNRELLFFYKNNPPFSINMSIKSSGYLVINDISIPVYNNERLKKESAERAENLLKEAADIQVEKT